MAVIRIKAEGKFPAPRQGLYYYWQPVHGKIGPGHLTSVLGF